MQDPEKNFYEYLQSIRAINEPLQVQILDTENTGNYYSRINDISEGRLVIAWPTRRGIRLLVRRDQILELSFVRDGNPYAFTGLIDETNLGPPPEVTIILSSPVMQVQRRQNFRIKCLVPVEIYGSYKEDKRDDSLSTIDIKVPTYDLSASGLGIRHMKRIPEETYLDVKMALPDDGPVLKIPCRVIYSESLPENHAQYRTGISYLTLTESERARIVRYIYRTQLKGLRG
jgi:c-di-GMP-binding flagellar brake protein YcgR